MEREFQINWPVLVEEAVRRRRGMRLTQKQLAALADVSTPTVSRFEQAEKDLQLSSMLAILDVLGMTDKRALVFVGDGSFQETCQELSTHTRLRHDTVLFVLNNEDFYGIEQMLVHPCFYKGQEEEQFYNVLHPWRYAKLAEVFATEDTPARGYTVSNQGELDDVLKALSEKDRKGPTLVQVLLPRKSFPKAIGYSLDKCPP